MHHDLLGLGKVDRDRKSNVDDTLVEQVVRNGVRCMRVL